MHIRTYNFSTYVAVSAWKQEMLFKLAYKLLAYILEYVGIDL